MQKLGRIKELIATLNNASKAYYQEAKEIMTNFEYDKLYDELLSLEEETGIILSNSPTQNVGYEVVSKLPKQEHETPMLSLDKTKDRDTLANWCGDKDCVLSWKLDGLTVVLTYNHGFLQKAVTRGNGYTGEVITSNARAFDNVPLAIDYKGKLVLRGEAVIKYSDFDRINESLPEGQEKYKNPRNLCSGSVRQLDSYVTYQRHVNFFAFNLVNVDIDIPTVKGRFSFLESQGFDVVEHKLVTKETLKETVEWFENKIETNDFPSDGLVITYNDYEYGLSLGSTGKFPRHSYAFKWQDEIATTTLREVVWQTSRTGLINPVAVFDTVELEGTSVSKATLNNISFIEELELGIGDSIEVYKANMIIPTIAKNLTRSNTLEIPKVCPVCMGIAEVKQDGESKMLYCTNDDCQAKIVKRLTHFVSRNAMNIDGLSISTLEKFADKGWLTDLSDIYNLEAYEEEILQMDGFKDKSVNKLLSNIDKSRTVKLENFLFAQGIPSIGQSTSKDLAKAFISWEALKQAIESKDTQLLSVLGEVSYSNLIKWYDRYRPSVDSYVFETRINVLDYVKPQQSSKKDLTGLIFVITGSVNHYPNRDAIKIEIESLGGKVGGSVSSKTSYLINNDSLSNSSKNKKAKDLGIPIITEEEYIALINQ